MDSHARAHPRIDPCSCTNGVNLCNTFLGQNVRSPATFLLSNHRCHRAKPPNSVLADALEAAREATSVPHQLPANIGYCLANSGFDRQKHGVSRSMTRVASATVPLGFRTFVPIEEGQHAAREGLHATQHGEADKAERASCRVLRVARPEASQQATEESRRVV